MKFGLYSSIADPPAGNDLARCVEEVMDEAQLAEEQGFDSCFFGEHHQDRDGFLPSPLIVATAVASRTRRLKVGTSVILLPLHHPVQLAEDVVTLDIVSRGRIILGVGLGYQPADFRAFGIHMENRVGLLEEGMEIIRNCWTGQPFSFSGKHYDLDEVQVLPPPFQKPSPPMWIGASTPRGARRAGRLADGFVAGPSTDLEGTKTLVETYRQAAVRAGREPQVVLMRDAWVASSRGEAEQVYGPEVIAAYKYYMAKRPVRVPEHSIRRGDYPGQGGLPTPDSRRSRRVRRAVPSLEGGYRSRLLLVASPPRPLRWAFPRKDHGSHYALRRKGDTLLRLTSCLVNSLTSARLCDIPYPPSSFRRKPESREVLTGSRPSPG